MEGIMIGIVGSKRRKSTYYMVEKILKESGKPYEIICLGDEGILSCCGSYSCLNADGCVQNDSMEMIRDKLLNAKGVVLGSPTYFDNVSGLMKTFMDRCLPFYFSGKLEGKRVAIVTCANIAELLEFDSEGKCLWHEEEKKSAEGCLRAMRDFCAILKMNVIGEAYALHEDPSSIDEELKTLGKKFCE